MNADRVLTGVLFGCLTLIALIGFVRVYAALRYGAHCDLWGCQ